MALRATAFADSKSAPGTANKVSIITLK